MELHVALRNAESQIGHIRTGTARTETATETGSHLHRDLQAAELEARAVEGALDLAYAAQHRRMRLLITTAPPHPPRWFGRPPGGGTER
jgi:hypothetical protein